MESMRHHLFLCFFGHLKSVSKDHLFSCSHSAKSVWLSNINVIYHPIIYIPLIMFYTGAFAIYAMSEIVEDTDMLSVSGKAEVSPSLILHE